MFNNAFSRWFFGLASAGALLALNVQAEEPPQAGEDQHLLYVAVSDMATGVNHIPGIYVFDIDHGYKLVKRLDIPGLGGSRGICASAANGYLYVTYLNTSILCYDLVREKVVWNNVYKPEEGGCDRPCVTPDGKKVYVPEGWWGKGKTTKCLKVLDGATGKLLKSIPVDVNGGHMAIMTLDGKRVYLGCVGNDTLVVVDTQTDEVINRVSGFGPQGPKGRCSPFTINGAETLCFANSHDAGFYVADLKNNKILYWVPVEGAKGFSHGISLTPDEKELWLVDTKDKNIRVYDATKMPPVFEQAIPINADYHGWIMFSVDGSIAWSDTGEVIDTATRKVIATLTDENGTLLRSAKFIEIFFRNGKPVRIGNPVAIGCKT